MDDAERDGAAGRDDEARDGGATPGRAARPPDEGPAVDGGSGLDEDDDAADEEIGGGD